MHPISPELDDVLEYHSWLIEKYGGTHGLRDRGALESALAAPLNRYHYKHVDLVVCAATYAYHLSQAHAFLDGNKRIAAAITELFLNVNGLHLRASDQDMIELFLRIAAGECNRDEIENVLAQWVWSR